MLAAKAAALIKLARLDHGVMVALATFVGGFVAAGASLLSPPYSHRVLLGMAVGVLVEAGIFALNDYFNVEEDRINAPDRPLVRGDLTPGEALALGVPCLIAGISLNLALNLEALLLVAAVVALGLLYNCRLKREGLLGNLLVASSTALPFIYGALVLESPPSVPPANYAFSLAAFLAAMGREIVKGIRDLEGDRLVGIKTVAVTAGPRAAARSALALFSSAIAASVVPALYLRSPLLYAAAIAPVDALFAYAGAVIAREPTVDGAERVRKLTLLGMAAGILGFLVGSL